MRTLSITLFATVFALTPGMAAQAQASYEEVQHLRQLVLDLERRVAALEQENGRLQTAGGRSGSTGPQTAAALMNATTELRVPGSASALPQQTTPESSTTSAATAAPLQGTLPGGATLNYYFDGYYEYNLNQPIGRVNDLRAYDVLSNTFSLNQADLVLDDEPNLDLHRRYGFRLDLQFGQATETLQGNPANEPRPDIYRNIFQAYGSYIAPVGKGLDLDLGKWASSLGIEGNYAKDRMNYTRSWFFNFLPFYHAGIRANYKFNDRIAANYWIVNGTDQSEPTNGYKDELFGLVLTPAKAVSWTVNYYNGQEHPNTVAAANCIVPVQPGLCEAPITRAPNGKTHIFDSYATWQATKKLTLAGEGDYFITRAWANAGPGESSAPSHVSGGAAYAQYQFTEKTALAARSEYLSDPDGLFSNVSQALKEVTGTYKHTVGDGFDVFLEYRRDWSNRLYFGTSNPEARAGAQPTATMGLVWWYGGKQGSW